MYQVLDIGDHVYVHNENTGHTYLCTVSSVNTDGAFLSFNGSNIGHVTFVDVDFVDNHNTCNYYTFSDRIVLG